MTTTRKKTIFSIIIAVVALSLTAAALLTPHASAKRIFVIQRHQAIHSSHPSTLPTKPTQPAPTTSQSTTTQPAPATTSPPAPQPAPATTSPPAPQPAPPPTTVPVTTTESSWSCAAAIAYLKAHANPSFSIQCPGNAFGREAMTCFNNSYCPGQHIIAIADPCPAAYMNEASNSWVLVGQSTAPIDPYGVCPS